MSKKEPKFDIVCKGCGCVSSIVLDVTKWRGNLLITAECKACGNTEVLKSIEHN